MINVVGPWADALKPEAIRISFDLVREPILPDTIPGVRYFPHRDRFYYPYGEVRPPYIEAVIGLPLPPPGVIALNYDAVVRKHHRWHESLPYEANRQAKKSAIRTWAVGLLVGMGEDTDAAMRVFCDKIDPERCEVSQDKFTRDRKLLLERVPEATNHLYQRKPRGAV